MSTRFTHKTIIILLALLLSFFSSYLYAQREFRVLQSMEGDAYAVLPDDYMVPGEFVVGRLMYPSYGGMFGGGEGKVTKVSEL